MPAPLRWEGNTNQFWQGYRDNPAGDNQSTTYQLDMGACPRATPCSGPSAGVGGITLKVYNDSKTTDYQLTATASWSGGSISVPSGFATAGKGDQFNQGGTSNTNFGMGNIFGGPAIPRNTLIEIKITGNGGSQSRFYMLP